MVGGRLPIPAIHTDFPLAALGEELGLIGVLAILGLYLVIIERGLRIAAAAADDFRALLAAGLALVVGVQAFIIAAGNLKLIPLTGITLPFISYGGSSLLANARRRRPAARPVRPRRRAAPAAAPESRPDRSPCSGGPWHGRRAPDAAPRASPDRPGRRPGRRRAPEPGCSPSSRSAPATGRSSGRPSSAGRPDNPLVIAAARNVVRGQIVDRDGRRPGDARKRDANGEPYRVYAEQGRWRR